MTIPIHGDELAERIRQLAAQGLRVRDISSLLHIHPEIVKRTLEEHAAAFPVEKVFPLESGQAQ